MLQEQLSTIWTAVFYNSWTESFFFNGRFCWAAKNSCNFINTFDHGGGGQVAWDQNGKSWREKLWNKKNTEDVASRCQRFTRHPVISKYSKERRQPHIHARTHTHAHQWGRKPAHADRSIFRRYNFTGRNYCGLLDLLFAFHPKSQIAQALM